MLNIYVGQGADDDLTAKGDIIDMFITIIVCPIYKKNLILTISKGIYKQAISFYYFPLFSKIDQKLLKCLLKMNFSRYKIEKILRKKIAYTEWGLIMNMYSKYFKEIIIEEESKPFFGNQSFILKDKKGKMLLSKDGITTNVL